MEICFPARLPKHTFWYEHPELHKSRLKCGVHHRLDTTKWIRISSGLDDFRHGPPRSNMGCVVPAHDKFNFFSDYMITHTAAAVAAATKKKEDEPIPVTQKTTMTNKLERFRNQPAALLPILEQPLPDYIFKKLFGLLHVSDDANIGVTAKVSGITAKSQQPLPRKSSAPTLSASSKEKSESQLLKRSYSAIETEEEETTERKKLKTSASSSSTKHSSDSTLQAKPSKENQEEVDSNLGLVESLIELQTSETKKFKLHGNPYQNFILQSGKSQKKFKKKTTPILRDLPFRSLADEFCDWASALYHEQDVFKLDTEAVLTLFAVNTSDTGSPTEIQIMNRLMLPAKLLELEDDTDFIIYKPTLLPLPDMKKFKHYRYGTWYLDVNLWKTMLSDEPLIDPTTMKQKHIRDRKEDSTNWDEILSGMYSTKLYYEYLTRNNLKIPHSMKKVWI